MTADSLNSMEQRLEGSIAELKADVVDLKHGMRQLDVKVDMTQRVMSEQMDRGFRQIIDTSTGDNGPRIEPREHESRPAKTMQSRLSIVSSATRVGPACVRESSASVVGHQALVPGSPSSRPSCRPVFVPGVQCQVVSQFCQVAQGRTVVTHGAQHVPPEADRVSKDRKRPSTLTVQAVTVHYCPTPAACPYGSAKRGGVGTRWVGVRWGGSAR